MSVDNKDDGFGVGLNLDQPAPPPTVSELAKIAASTARNPSAVDLLEPLPAGNSYAMKTKIPILSADGNWDDYTMQLCGVLRSRKMYSIVMSPESPLHATKRNGEALDVDDLRLIYEKDNAAFNLLLESVDSIHKVHFNHLDPLTASTDTFLARSAWLCLSQFFDRKDSETVLRHLLDLIDSKHEPTTTTVAEHLCHRRNLETKIKSSGITLDQLFLLLSIRSFTHEHYTHAKNSLLDGNMERLTYSRVKQKFELAEARGVENDKEVGSTPTAFATHSGTFQLPCLNNCGGKHPYWRCQQPLRPALQQKRDDYVAKQKARSLFRTSSSQEAHSTSPQILSLEQKVKELQQQLAMASSKPARTVRFPHEAHFTESSSGPAVPESTRSSSLRGFWWTILPCLFFACNLAFGVVSCFGEAQ